MFKITLKTDLPQQLQAAQQNLERGLPSVLQQCATFILQEQKFSFEDKSRGGSGADGRAWKALKQSTEIKKASRKAKFRNARLNVRKLNRKLAGVTTKQARVGLLKRLDKARAGSAVPKSQIGVDTGLLRNSGNPGFKSPDGKGGQRTYLELNGTRIVMEYGRSYAKHFDEVRPLFPATTPPAWAQGIEQIVNDWIDQQLAGIS